MTPSQAWGIIRRKLGYCGNWTQHDWRRNDVSKGEVFPICNICGRNCWYMLGYMTSSGQYLKGNSQAHEVWDRTLFDRDENLKQTHEYWSTRDAEGNPIPMAQAK